MVTSSVFYANCDQLHTSFKGLKQIPVLKEKKNLYQNPHILAISYLFPNSVYPAFGIFVLHRLKAVSKHSKVIVINPVPWFPFCKKFQRYKDFDKIPKKEIIQGIDVHHPRFFIIPKYFKFFDAVSYFLSVRPVVKKIAKYHRFDLIDLHWTYPDIFAGVVLSRMYQKKWLMTVRGIAGLNVFCDLKNNRFYEEKSLRQFMLKALIKKAPKIIALSPELKKICADFGVVDNRISIIPNGIDHTRFYYIKKSLARGRLNLPKNITIIFTVGSLIYIKGFDRVIKGLGRLRQGSRKIVYYIAGSTGAAGDYSTELRETAKRNGVESAVVFLGQVHHSDLVFWYNAADIYCLASRSEGCPNALMEALTCGCPSVATRVGMVDDIFQKELMGELVENKGEAVIKGIETALAKTYDRKKISSQMQHHSWERCAVKVVDEYQKLMVSHE